MRRYYELLDISEDATQGQIKRAWKLAASVLHPDKNPGNEEEAARKFQEVKEAYECLSNPERRAAYDETGDISVETGSPAEDLLLHLLNEIAEHVETASEVLTKLKAVIEQMIEECAERKLHTDEQSGKIQVMLTAVKFKGKGVNFVAEVLKSKLEKLTAEREDLTKAENTAKIVWDMLKEYEATDEPLFDTDFDTPESLRVKTIESMLRGTFGTRPGGMPFSGV